MSGRGGAGPGAQRPPVKVVIEPESVGGRVPPGDDWAGRIELPGVGIEARVFEFAMGTEVIAACVRGSAQWTLEPAREVHVIVIANVSHYFPTQFAPVQVAATWQLVKR